ncbi:MAG: hypothetical protein ABIJ35_00780, partial [Acidobacteriota bacterium]
FEFVAAEEIQELINEETAHHEAQIGILEAFLESVEKRDTLFHDKETDEWFLVEKGKPVPLHLQEGLLKKQL